MGVGDRRIGVGKSVSTHSTDTQPQDQLQNNLVWLLYLRPKISLYEELFCVFLQLLVHLLYIQKPFVFVFELLYDFLKTDL